VPEKGKGADRAKKEKRASMNDFVTSHLEEVPKISRKSGSRRTGKAGVSGKSNERRRRRRLSADDRPEGPRVAPAPRGRNHRAREKRRGTYTSGWFNTLPVGISKAKHAVEERGRETSCPYSSLQSLSRRGGRGKGTPPWRVEEGT